MTSHFLHALSAVQPDAADRRWIYVPYDQLNDRIGPLGDADPAGVGIVLIETTAKPAKRPYHKQKLAYLLTNQRHFALEQAARGVAVDYRFSTADYDVVLREVIAERGPLICARPAERELRHTLAALVEQGGLRFVAHTGWLTTTDDFVRGAGAEAPWRMDAFYRHVRQSTGLLMEGESPLGGRYSHDGDNRQPWSGEPAAPEPPSFEVDIITEEVGQLIEDVFADHPGELNLGAIPATAAHASRAWDWAKSSCLKHFGPFEDAMSTGHRSLFHTQVAPLLNLHRLLAADVVADTAAMDLPLNSKEGFIRQILGWREFVRHVHDATDGFRSLDASKTGDAGAANAGAANVSETDDLGADPSVLGARRPLPAAWWDAPSGLNCLDTVVAEVWEHGWTHHIPRLMVLSNLATLLDVSPRELTDWFWVAFVDAYDWVVEPNVLAMGTFGTGPVMTTKPYVSGANYLHKMGDYCGSCRFHPKKTCPITPLYWAFLARHRDTLGSNQRMSLALGGLKRRSEERQREDRETFERVWAALEAGEEVQV